MKTFNIIFGIISLLIGIFSVIGGMSTDSLSVVIGGGLFMALGVITLILSEKK